eukprot:Clim_evm35s44 gene=Clim_evmTU35s44
MYKGRKRPSSGGKSGGRDRRHGRHHHGKRNHNNDSRGHNNFSRLLQDQNLIAKDEATLARENALDDAVLNRTAKKLGLDPKSKKISKEFTADGLDDILGVLGEYNDRDSDLSDVESALESSMEDEDDSDEAMEPGWKRRKHEVKFAEAMKNNESDDDEDEDEEDGRESDEQESGVEEENIREESDESEESTDEDKSEKKQPPEKTGGYVPPSLRRRMAALNGEDKDRAEILRLEKLLRGQLNRLSDENMLPIMQSICAVFFDNSKTLTSHALTNIILRQATDSGRLLDKFLLNFSGALAVLHDVIGLEVTGHFVQALAHTFQKEWQHVHEDQDQEKVDDHGRKCRNLVAMFAFLYILNVVNCNLIYDVVRKLASNMMERDIELVVILLQNVGMNLRKDDPAALKEIIQLIQTKVADANENVTSSARSRFMMDLLQDIKNNRNRTKKAAIFEQASATQNTVMEVRRKLASSGPKKKGGTGGHLQEPMTVGLHDLLEAPAKGRWWLVGSAWRGKQVGDDHDDDEDEVDMRKQKKAGSSSDAKIMQLAKKQRMTTDIRRAIFTVIMSADDINDAFEKLLKMGLKKEQQRDIVRVIIDCCVQEQSFNPYYAVLLTRFVRLSTDFKYTFQYALWDRLKVLNQSDVRQIRNLARLVSHLVLVKKGVSLAVVRIIDVTNTRARETLFLRICLTSILLQDITVEDVSGGLREQEEIFGKGLQAGEHTDTLRLGLKLFMRQYLGAQAGDNIPGIRTEKDRKRLNRAVKQAIRHIEDAEAVEAQGGYGSD